MSTGDRVFLARLAGIAVFDPNGDQLGKVRDAVTMLRTDRQPPRVLGLVVELVQRHRIFVPMGRVTRIEPDQVVLSSGTVNMRRFERRTNEILVLTELLDRSVTMRESGQVAGIVDAAMEPTRARDWVITRLAVRTADRRLTRRRGQLFQVEWNEVDGLALTEPEPGHRRAARDAVGHARRRRRHRAAWTCRTSAASRSPRRSTTSGWPTCCRRCRRTTRSSLLRSLADERAADVLEAMDDDDAADLLGEMPAADQERLLS